MELLNGRKRKPLSGGTLASTRTEATVKALICAFVPILPCTLQSVKKGGAFNG